MDLFAIVPKSRTRTNWWKSYIKSSKLKELWNKLCLGAVVLEVFKEKLGNPLCEII